MTEPLTRDEVIHLLEALGGEKDEEVLEAARNLHAGTVGAGLDWDDLLRPEEADTETEEPEEEEEPEERPAAPAPDDKASLKLIAELKALPDSTEELKQELNAYETDIRNGELDEGDRRYIGALHERLAPKR